MSLLDSLNKLTNVIFWIMNNLLWIALLVGGSYVAYRIIKNMRQIRQENLDKLELTETNEKT